MINFHKTIKFLYYHNGITIDLKTRNYQTILLHSESQYLRNSEELALKLRRKTTA